MRRVSIKDVAREAGVAISTVSNALNGVDVVHPDTKNYILEIAEKMQYVPNLNGKNLKTKETKVIGLLISSLKGSYYGEISDAMYNECQKYGYELNIFIYQQISNVMMSLMGRRVDGTVILNRCIKNENIETLINEKVPVVFLDREIASDCISSVIFDSFSSGKIAAEYLLSLGHKKIAYIKGIMHTYDGLERYHGFISVMNEVGLNIEEEYMISGFFDRDKTYLAVKEFLKSGLEMPDAFCAANDLSAVGCIEALQEAGIRIPEDVSVIGCDNIEMCEWFCPTITTVKTSYDKQAKLAVQTLVEIIQGKEVGKAEKLTGEIIVRNSCKKRE